MLVLLAWPDRRGSKKAVRGAGINSVVFYAPVLFSSLGMGQDSALLSSVITGAVFVAATIISILTVDSFGRKVCHCTHAPNKLLTLLITQRRLASLTLYVTSHGPMIWCLCRIGCIILPTLTGLAVG